MQMSSCSLFHIKFKNDISKDVWFFKLFSEHCPDNTKNVYYDIITLMWCADKNPMEWAGENWLFSSYKCVVWRNDAMKPTIGKQTLQLLISSKSHFHTKRVSTVCVNWETPGQLCFVR